jgi:hypothetical protein
MASKRGGLGRGLTELLDDQARAAQARQAKGGSRSDGLDVLIPTAEDIAIRDARVNSKSLSLNGAQDTDFGVGYEVVDPAPSRGLDKRGARAQKLGYNRQLKYLVILMRDGALVGYEGVEPDEWEQLENFVSTTDYIETVLYRYQGGGWNTVYGKPPQSNDQNFEQGTQD